MWPIVGTVKSEARTSPGNLPLRFPLSQHWIKRVLAAAITPIIFLAVASMGLVATDISRHAAFSPFDEYVYLDYLHKFPTEIAEKQGEPTGDFARNELACRGVFMYGSFGEGCNSGKTSDASKFPYGGRQGADIYTPVYFAITWVIAAPLTSVGVGELDAGRLAGGLWLALGAVLLYLCLCQLGISRKLSVGIPLVVLATPAIEWANSYLSTDAPTLAVGAGLAYAGVRIWKGNWSPFWLIPLVMVSVALKVQNLAAFAIVGLALLAARLWRPGNDRGYGRLRAIVTDRVVVGVFAAGLAGIATQLIWMVIRARIALGPGGPPITGPAHLTPTALLQESVKFILQVGSSGVAVGFPEELASVLLSILTILAVFSLSLEGLVARSVAAIISWSTGAIALIFGPLLVIATGIAIGYYVPLTPRYGIVLLPAFALCVGLFLQRYRLSGNIALGIGLVLVGAALIG